MADSTKKEYPPIENLIELQDRHRNEVLTDDQIIDFILNPDVLSVESGVIWFGADTPILATPIMRYSEIASQKFPTLEPKEKLKFLEGSAKLLFMQRENAWFERKGHTATTKFAGGDYRIAHQRNIGEFLKECLDFCNEDLDEARRLVKHLVQRKITEGATIPLQRFFYKGDDPEPYNDPFVEVDKYNKNNSKIPLLAFWIMADLGRFNVNGGPFLTLLESAFSRANSELQTEIMRHTAKSIAGFRAKGRMFVEIRLFLARNEDLYERAKINGDSTFVAAYESVGNSIAFSQIIEKTKGGKIKVDDLVDLLEGNPNFVQYVYLEELETALDSTSDHGVALKLERMIKAKKALIEETS